MSIKHLAVAAGLFLAGIGTFSQAQQPSRGVINFHGSIVEPSCNASSEGESLMQLKGCTTASRGNLISAHSVQPFNTVKSVQGSATQVRLVADSGTNGRYYNQSYQLMDNAGAPVRSGSYVVTITAQ